VYGWCLTKPDNDIVQGHKEGASPDAGCIAEGCSLQLHQQWVGVMLGASKGTSCHCGAYQEGPNQAKTRSACEPERDVGAVVLIPAVQQVGRVSVHTASWTMGGAQRA
jgi:hypothetical protein